MEPVERRKQNSIDSNFLRTSNKYPASNLPKTSLFIVRTKPKTSFDKNTHIVATGNENQLGNGSKPNTVRNADQVSTEKNSYLRVFVYIL